MLYLLQAELASVQGQRDKAAEKYLAALAMNNFTGVLGLLAVTYERAALHFTFVGDKTRARQYYDGACRTYEEWGATVKVRALKEHVSAIYKDDTSNSNCAVTTSNGEQR